MHFKSTDESDIMSILSTLPKLTFPGEKLPGMNTHVSSSPGPKPQRKTSGKFIRHPLQGPNPLISMVTFGLPLTLSFIIFLRNLYRVLTLC